MLRVNVQTNSANVHLSLAETVVLTVFQRCVRQPMKISIRNYIRLGEALEITIRLEQQHG